MTEIEKINSNNNGELPIGEKTIFRAFNINNPQQVLDNCKRVVKALINHPNTNPSSNEWKALFPKTYVQFLDGLTREDFMYDELLYSIEGIVKGFQNENLREWRWYSSKLTANGFEIVFEGWCSFRNYWLIHAQGIPYSKIEITDKQGTGLPKTIKDAALK